MIVGGFLQNPPTIMYNPKNRAPLRVRGAILKQNQNFREFSLMPGPMVVEITAERM